MPAHVYDAVTLRHLGFVDFDLLKNAHDHHDLPRWVDAVESEIDAAAAIRPAPTEVGAVVANRAWLGQPAAADDQLAVFTLQTRLAGTQSGVGNDHLGEAESIVWAQEHPGSVFYTDDNDAHRVGSSMLGPTRVRDSVDVLQDAAAAGVCTQNYAYAQYVAIRDSTDRHLRRQRAALSLQDF